MTLSQASWEELRTIPFRSTPKSIRLLAHNPGCLDLYTWLTWRCHQARGRTSPLFGPFGIASQLGVQAFTRERKFRERLETLGLSWFVSIGQNSVLRCYLANGTFL